jgi:hypothetical protein
MILSALQSKMSQRTSHGPNEVPKADLGVILGTVATCATALLVAYALTGFPFVTDYSKGYAFNVYPDVLHERVTAWEAINGDPYRPVGEMMADHGFPGLEAGVAPRTPAALMFQTPLLVVPESYLMLVVTSLLLPLLFYILWLTHTISRVEWRRVVWVGPLLFISFPVVTALSFGSLSAVLTVALILVAWAFQDRGWAGIPLGIATAWKLWPALVVIGFWLLGRRRASYQAGVVFVLMNAAGLLLPGVSVAGSLESLRAGNDDWLEHSQNASLARVLFGLGIPAGVGIVVGAGVGCWLAIRDKSRAIALTVVAALLASPLSWPSYALAALPAGALWWRRGRGLALAALAAPYVLWVFVPFWWKGYAMFASLAVLLILLGQMHSSPAVEGTVESAAPAARDGERSQS